MPSPGLSRGARLLRRWRSHSDIRRIHPWRTAATVALWWPCCLLALAMRGIAWAGERVSGLDDAAERMLGAIRHWLFVRWLFAPAKGGAERRGTQRDSRNGCAK